MPASRAGIAVEIAAGDGIECNAANLLLHHGFTGLLFESHPEKRAAGEEFYAKHPATSYFPPRFVGEWVTRENVDGLIAAPHAHGRPRRWWRDRPAEPGHRRKRLLELIFDALHCVSPRVVIVEFNALWGATRAVTIPYAADFVAEPGLIAYLGASLPAFVKLLGKRGYRLVGVERLGFNAVFVRNDLAPAVLEVSAEVCLRGPIVGICQAKLDADLEFGAAVRARPWVNV